MIFFWKEQSAGMILFKKNLAERIVKLIVYPENAMITTE